MDLGQFFKDNKKLNLRRAMQVLGHGISMINAIFIPLDVLLDIYQSCLQIKRYKLDMLACKYELRKTQGFC